MDMDKILQCEVFEENSLKGVKCDSKIIIPAKFDAAIVRKYGILVQKNGLWGAYSADGNQILPIEFEQIIFCDIHFIIAKKDGRYGVCKYDGVFIVPIAYYAIYCDHLGIFAKKEKDSEWEKVFPEKN